MKRLLIVFGIVAGAALAAGAGGIGALRAQEAPTPAAAARPSVPADTVQAYFYYMLARDDMLAERFNEAERNLNEALRYDPASQFLQVERARFMLQMQKYRDAREELERLIRENPGNIQARKLLAGMYLSMLGEGPPADENVQTLLQQTIDMYRAVLETAPDDSDSLFALGRILFRQRRLPEAEEMLRRYTELNPSAAEGAYFLTLVYAEQGKYEEALTALRVVEQQRPPSIQIRMLRADILEKMGRLDDAAQIHQQAVDQAPDDARAYLNYARLLLKSGKPAEALAALDKSRENGVVSSDVLMYSGEIHREQLRFDEAIRCFKDAIALEPAVPDYRFQLGLTYSQMGDAVAAIPMFQALIRDTPVAGTDTPPDAARNRRLFMLNLGYLYLEQRLPEKALEVFTQIRREYPDDRDPLAHAQIAAILRALKRSDDSLAAAQTGLDVLPDNPRLIAEKAQTLAAAGRIDEGVALLQDRLTAAREDDIPLYLGLAAIHVEGQRWDDALHALETALSRHADDAQLLFQHAAVLERAGRFGPAADAFRRLLADDPDNATALNYLGYMLIDNDLDVKAGIGHVQQALKREPKNPAYLDSLGWGHYKQKEYRKALDLLLQAARALPTDPTLQEHLGDVYRALGRTHDARDCYEKALSFSPEADALPRLKDKLKKLKPRLQK